MSRRSRANPGHRSRAFDGLEIRWLGLAAAALVVLIWVVPGASAEAQRRRRRTPPPAEQAAETPEQGAGPGQEAPPNPFDDPGAARPPAAEVATPADPAAAGTAAAAQQPAAEEESDADGIFGPDLGPLLEEFTGIMDDLVQTRSRIAVLGRQLFNTRVRVAIQNRASDQTLEGVVLSLDGAPIYRAESGELSEDDTVEALDGFAAPGPHALTVEIEQRARADDAYRYDLRDTYRFQVQRGVMTDVTIVLDDDSDIAEDFSDDGEGEYDVRTRVRVATRELEGR